MKKSHLIEKLRIWFQQHKRELPWRRHSSPYAVWVSEVMLQQTQVAVVIPYFERWMKQFPTIASLAQAPIDDVLKAWEGLGYYSRARNLHAGAQYVVSHFGGQLPQNADELQQIKGLGAYTVGAIRSFAFHQKASAVDGNVIRVLTRLLAIEDDIAKPKTLAKIRAIADQLLPDHDPWVIVEALIELGATVCGRQPKCYECPLSSGCDAYQEGKESELPFKSTKTVIEQLHRAVLVVRHQNQLLVKKGEPGKIMSDLYEFPYLESLPSPDSQPLIQHAKKNWNLVLRFVQPLEQTKHSFTRYRVNLYPILFHANTTPNIPSHAWMEISELQKKPFSSGHRKIFQTMEI